MSKSTPLRGFYTPHARIQVTDFGPSMAKQSMAAETDINNIMRKYEKSGMIAHVSRYKGQYADVAHSVDYHEGLNSMIRAEEMFDSLSARIRERFNNNPGEFLAFVEDPENLEEMQTLGLLNKPPAKAEIASADTPGKPEKTAENKAEPQS